MFKIEINGQRYYYNVSPKIKLLPSVTTIVKKIIPTSNFLFQWSIDNFNSYADYQKFMQEKADYGTALHIVFARFCEEKGVFDIGMLADINDGYKKDIMSDMVCLNKWYHDNNVEPLAIETMVSSETLGYAGTIDLIANVNGERTIVDLKSNRSGNYYEEHIAQLMLYREICQDINPNANYKYSLMNISPTDFTKRTRNFYHCQSYETYFDYVIMARCAIGLYFNGAPKKTERIIDDKLNVFFADLPQILMQKHDLDYLPEII